VEEGRGEAKYVLRVKSVGEKKKNSGDREEKRTGQIESDKNPGRAVTPRESVKGGEEEWHRPQQREVCGIIGKCANGFSGSKPGRKSHGGKTIRHAWNVGKGTSCSVNARNSKKKKRQI